MVRQKDDRVVIVIDKLRYHPLSTILLVVWVVVVGATIGLLERAVIVSRQSVSIPWQYQTDGLPSLLVTLVAQAHGGITTMHLARLAVSGLFTSLGRPHSWMELFWLATGKWSGPVGMLETVWTVFRLRIRRISCVFVLFALIMASALALPLVLERAYPASAINVTVVERLAFTTPSDAGSRHVTAYSKLVTGNGGATRQSVIAAFNRTTYIPVGAPRENSSNDMFIAGDILGRDVTLVGVRIQGSCVDMEVDRDTLFDDGGLDEKVAQTCKENADFNMSWCSHLTTFQPFNQSTDTPKSIMIFGYAAEFDRGLEDGSSIRDKRAGIIRCEVTTLVGHARLNGRELTYTDFVADPEALTFADYDDPIRDPLSATLYAMILNVPGLDQVSNLIQGPSLRAQVGMTNDIFLSRPLPPTPQGFAQAMWNGATDMSAALAILSHSDATEYDAVTHHTISGYKRIDKYFYGVLILLGLWLLGLAVTSGLFLRRSFSDTLDEYVVARLLAQRPDLVDDVDAGAIDENEKLRQRFDGIELRLGAAADQSGVELLEPGQMSPAENSK